MRALAALRWEMVAGDVEAHLAAAASATVTRAFPNEFVLAIQNPPNESFVRLVSASVKRPPHFEAAKEFGTCQASAAARVQLLGVVTCGGVAFLARGVGYRLPIAGAGQRGRTRATGVAAARSIRTAATRDHP